MTKWLRMFGVFAAGVALGYGLGSAHKRARRTLTRFERAAVHAQNHKEVQSIREKAREKVVNGR